MADQLAVWLYDTRAALVDQLRGRLRLSYTEDALSGTASAYRFYRCHYLSDPSVTRMA